MEPSDSSSACTRKRCERNSVNSALQYELQGDGVTKNVEGLRSRVLRAGSWTIVGVALGQILRFGSNLVLTRLLFPEAFGIMAILTAVLVGVAMLSDVGLSMSIVRSKRGSDVAYMNTVWTMQIIKGVLVALGLWLAARFVGSAYDQPLLAEMLPALGLVALLNGFNSTKADLATREMRVAAPILLGLLAQVVGVTIMIGVALLKPTPWALLAGNVASAAVSMAGSHLMLPGPTNRLAWDVAAARDVAHFGGWIMLGSAVAYFAGDGTQLVRAALVDLRLLGLLGLASAMSIAAWSIIQQVAGRVLFPAYAEVWRHDPDRQASVVERARRVQLIAGGLFSIAMVIAGPAIVGLLYDARYADAGLVLQVQSAGMMVTLLSASYFGVLHARGRPGLSTAILACQVTINVACMLIGAKIAGGAGVVAGSALSGWIFYPINAWAYYKVGLWQPRTDLPMLIAAFIVSAWVAINGDWSVASAW